jgi:hypothetical protein
MLLVDVALLNLFSNQKLNYLYEYIMTLWIIMFLKTIDESKMLPPLTTRFKIYLFLVDIIGRLLVNISK